MKVKIIKCQNNSWWYALHVGDFFEVEDAMGTVTGDAAYIVREGDHDGCYITEEDCEIVKDIVKETKPTNPKDLIGSDKLPLHLFPTTAIAQGSIALLDGALKYGRTNYRAVGVRASIYHDACLRHMTKWFEGEEFDEDSGVHHLGHAIACIAILIDAKAAGKLNDDRMIEGGYLEMLKELTAQVKTLKEKHKALSPKHYTIADNELL